MLLTKIVTRYFENHKKRTIKSRGQNTCTETSVLKQATR